MRFNDHKNPDISVKRARELRNAATPFERKIWALLREGAKQKGLRFRRQQPIHPFIPDFACMEAKLLIELDGFSHEMRQDYDMSRDKKLREIGYTILRFTNDDVKTSAEGIVETILARAEELVLKIRAEALAEGPPP